MSLAGLSGFDEGLVGRDLLGVSEQRDGQLDGDAFQRLLAQTRGPNGEVVSDEEQLFELLVGLEVYFLYFLYTEG